MKAEHQKEILDANAMNIGADRNKNRIWDLDPYIIVEGNCQMVPTREYSVKVLKANYQRWKNGTLIQQAMPELSAADREWLQTGTHPESWDEMFEEDGSEDEYNQVDDESHD